LILRRLGVHLLRKAAAAVAAGLGVMSLPAVGRGAPVASARETPGSETVHEREAATGTERAAEVEGDQAKPDLLFNQATSLLVVTGAFAALNTWTYFAWYRQRATSDHLIFRNEGWFGPDTYAGGSDKLGHFFICHVMTWLSANVLMGAAATQGFFTFIEFKDARHPHYGFSWGDMLFNVAGSATALTLINVPVLDEMFDFRVDYVPSRLYFRRLKEHGAVNAGEDYSGQIYTFAYHLGSIPAVRQQPDLAWLRYLDLSFGYRARNYLPKPENPDTHRYQELILGIGLNAQHVLDVLWDRYQPPRRRVHGSLRFLTEMFAVPYTTLPAVKYQRDNGPAPEEEEEDAEP
jgi:hypothetical protein